MKLFIFNCLVMVGLGFSGYAAMASSDKGKDCLVMALEEESGITGNRRYIRIPVISGYQETRTALKNFLEGDYTHSEKSFHGKNYSITSVSGDIPEIFLDDEKSDLSGSLVNRSTNGALDPVIHAVYEFSEGPAEDKTSHYFVVEYTEKTQEK